MKKLIIITLIIIANSIQAQFFIEFNNGYAKGINNKKYFESENTYTNKDYYNLDTSNYSQYNLAQGFFIEPRVGYKINNWLSASVGFYYLVEKKDINFSNQSNKDFIDVYFVNDSTANAKYNNLVYNYNYSLKSQYGLTPEINIFKHFNNFCFQLNVGAYLSKMTIQYLVDSIKTEYNAGGDNSGGSGGIKKTSTYNNKHNLFGDINVSMRIGAEISYYMNNNLAIICKVYYNNLYFSPNKKETYYNYYNYFYTIYPSNTLGVSDTEVDETTKTVDIKGDNFGMNTLQFSFGIRYTFTKNKSE
jgi:hypothetical protein